MTTGTTSDTKVSQASDRFEWEWNGKEYYATLRPLTWQEEGRAVHESTDARGINVVAFTEYVLDHCVLDSNIDMTQGGRMGWEPDFGWRVLRAINIPDRIRRLGFTLSDQEATQKK